MKAFLILFSLAVTTNLFAQNDTWKVSHNGKTKLEAKAESEENVVTVKATDINKKGMLIVAFKEAAPQAAWQRQMMVFDPAENELKNTKGAFIKLDNAAVKAAFKKSNTLMIYTMALPKDPRIAATVRVRRVHLCTLVLK